MWGKTERSTTSVEASKIIQKGDKKYIEQDDSGKNKKARLKKKIITEATLTKRGVMRKEV